MNKTPSEINRYLVVCLSVAAIFAVSCSPSGPRAQYAEKMLKKYRSMEAGEWAIYDLREGVGMLLQVQSTDNDGLEIKRHTYFNKQPAMGNFIVEYRFEDIERNLLSGKDLTGKIEISAPEISQKTINAAGRTFNCTEYAIKTPGALIRIYYSDEVPVDGVVMIRRNGIIVRYLKAFGFAGEIIKLPTSAVL